jgi:hypothetical protein
LSFCFVGSSFAGELLKSEVKEVAEHFVLHLEMRIDADYDPVYDILVDFENLKELTETIKESELLESEDDVHVVRMRSEGCVLFYCQSVIQVTTVTELGRGYIKSIVDPELSDLSYGKVLWQIIEEDETTKIIYDADIVPDFWIPPLFGSYIFKSSLIEEAEKTINGIERVSIIYEDEN